MNALTSYTSDDSDDGAPTGSSCRKPNKMTDSSTNYDDVGMDISEDSDAEGEKRSSAGSISSNGQSTIMLSGQLSTSSNSSKVSNSSSTTSIDSRKRGSDDSRLSSGESSSRSSRNQRKSSEKGVKEGRDKTRGDRRKSRSRSRNRKRSRSLDRRRSRSKSRDRRRSRSKSRDRRRSRSKSRDRRRSRSKSRDRRRSRSKSRDRRRSRSRDRFKRRSSRRSRSKSPRNRRRSKSNSRSRDWNPEEICKDSLNPPMACKPVQPAMSVEELIKKGLEAQMAIIEKNTGIKLPTYYNPAVMNPLKVAEQERKKKLLWGNKSKTASTAAPSTVTTGQPTSGLASSGLWSQTKFSNDSDGKMADKFRRLMGVKSDGSGQATSSESAPSSSNIIKQQETLFEDMEQQYEVARMTTHTHRGYGLGFSSQPYLQPK